jgi:dGTPase
MKIFYDFLYENVYTNPSVKSEESKVEGILERLYEYYLNHIDKLPPGLYALIERDGKEQIVTDYIAGMSDSFVVSTYERLFVPQRSALKN